MMGTGGPGNIVHIDNLYVKTFNVQQNFSIDLGDYVVIEALGARPLAAGDFSGNDSFLDLSSVNVVQAGENANNLDAIDPSLRKNKIECITKGSDWVLVMGVDVLPDQPVGIFNVGAFTKVEARASSTAVTVIGVYKHKEFSTVANVSVLDDNGIISTGLGLS